jgi:GDP-L-fucose synthase
MFIWPQRKWGHPCQSRLSADFIRENLQIQTNVIHAAHQAGVQRLLFLGSSCIYPRLAKQPMAEDALLTGPLEPTNEAYAVAKIAGMRMCEAYHRQYGSDFRSVMPTNLYGPNDMTRIWPCSSGPRTSSTVLSRAANARWWCGGWPAPGIPPRGRPRCSLDHAWDSLTTGRQPERNSQVNVGCGEDVDRGIGRAGGSNRFKGEIVAMRPVDGTYGLLDTGRSGRGSRPLRDGIARTYEWMRTHLDADGREVQARQEAS